ncbi:MAG: hypothetical protein L0H53_07445 [Candidatus Nitrosocosmicus sp.]|nr:hypothetical protein [Candidatus Nitrosocosmicus sp.]
MGKKTKIVLGIFGGFIGLIILSAVYAALTLPKGEGGFIGDNPKLNHSGLTPAQIIEKAEMEEQLQQQQSDPAVVEDDNDASSMSSNDNEEPMNSDISEFTMHLI